MESLFRSTVGTELLRDLALVDAAEMMCTCQKMRDVGRSFAGVVAFAFTRPKRNYRASLRTWSGLYDSCAHTLQALQWRPNVFIVEVTRTVWTAHVTPHGTRVTMDALPCHKLLPLLSSMFCDCVKHGAVENLDEPDAPPDRLLRFIRTPFLVIALKGTFAFVQDSSPIPEFGLACLLRSASGQFAFMRMADPQRSWIQTIIGNDLQAVARRAQEKFGEQMWDVDEFGQLPWVRDKPLMWFQRGKLYQCLAKLEKEPASHPVRRQFPGSAPTWPGLLHEYHKVKLIYGSAVDVHWAAARPEEASLKEQVLACALSCHMLEMHVTRDTADPGSCIEQGSTGNASVGVEAAVTMENIVHQDLPAILSVEEAADVCQVQWAGFIERTLTSDSSSSGYVESVQLLPGGAQQPAESTDRALDSVGVAETRSGVTPSDASQHTDFATTATPQCLLPQTRVTTRLQQSMDASEIQIGDELLSGCGQAVVVAVRHFPVRDRDIVQITFGASGQEQLAVTASHILAIYRRSVHNIQPLLASEIRVGDYLRTHTHPARVTSCTPATIHTSVIEIELRESYSTMFISTGSTPVEAYGVTAPKLSHDQVKILSFNRFDHFRESLLGNEELEACRAALAGQGFSADLSVYMLGLGKMLVRADLAERVLQALATRRGAELKCNDVVVSSEFEPIVKIAVSQGTGRRIFVRHEEILQLPRTRVKRTFLDEASSSRDESAPICSTTDADKRKGKNPRTSRSHVARTS